MIRDEPLRAKVWCCTWNVAGEAPVEDDHVTVDSWLSITGDEANAPHIYAICLQEVGLSPLSLIFTDQWTDFITDTLCQNGMIRLHRSRQFGTLLLVFVKPFILPSISQIEESHIATGFGGFLGTKGAAIVRFRLYGKSVCITGCHLTPHTENLEKRNKEFHSICGEAEFTDPDCQSVLDHNYVFWLGDLNYRLSENVSHEMAVEAVETDQLHELRQHDQLHQEQRKGTAFVGFSEGLVTFQPTYKYEKGTQEFDTSRVPSWCDRVLWRTTDSDVVDITSYMSYPECCVSDHKPVAAHLEVNIVPENPRRGVEFAFPSEWVCGQQVFVSYSLESDVTTSSWDWIGLYKAGWQHLLDYDTYVWARSKHSTRRFHIPLDADIPREPGVYQLVYHSSYHKQVIGISPLFEVSSLEWV